MTMRKTRIGGMPAILATLGLLAPLAFAPSALGSNAEPAYEVLLASHPDWLKRHGLGRQPVTPYNPNQGGGAP